MAKSASRTARTIQILMRIRAALPPRCPHLKAPLRAHLLHSTRSIELAFDVAKDEIGSMARAYYAMNAPSLAAGGKAYIVARPWFIAELMIRSRCRYMNGLD